MLNRVDNLFFNTPDVAALAKYYSSTLSVPIRREQVLKPGLLWMELNVGGMELSFRKADGTPVEHPELVGNFLEVPPGQGATISFEVTNTEAVRSELERRGVQFRGGVIPCTEGKELISIFQDPFGRPVQLYEGRFASHAEAMVTAGRVSASVAQSPAGLMVANVRDIRDLALSISFTADDLAKVRSFYGDVLELPLRFEDQSRLAFVLDGTTIEFRRPELTPLADGANRLGSSSGGVVAIEVRQLDHALRRIGTAGLGIQATTFHLSGEHVGGRRAVFPDLDGNPIELWERDGVVVQ
jgi:catechol 2,3-dioxygenase-like lactoylglutathione lyase family enzyme